MTTDPYQGTPEIPGVRYVARTVFETERTTLDGVTTERQVPREVRVPAPPRDWDTVGLRVLIGASVLVTALSASWSTVSIGALLRGTADAWIAYPVAGVFELGWLTCQVREWLDRRDPDRARVPRALGWVALLITMAAIVGHGVKVHEPLVGGVGACVALLSKGMMINALGYYAVPLDPGMAHHLLTRRRGIAVKLALAAERRQLAGLEAYERLVYGDQPEAVVEISRGGDTPVTAVSPASPHPSPALIPTPPRPVAPAPSVPAPSPVSPQVVSPPVPASAPPVPASAPVPSQVLPPAVPASPAVPPAAPAAPAPASAPAPAPTTEPMRPLLQVVDGPPMTKTDFIRSLLEADPDVDLDTLTERVRQVYGEKRDLRKDVSRLRLRIKQRAS
ncbi:hypothetical protein [Streptomyces sp. CA-253872]|uniref:hypothetical protein n=1 Tax=Streptomyces sp. CA-253872 TaxID=3240067 RepID=UPI003D8B251E